MKSAMTGTSGWNTLISEREETNKQTENNRKKRRRNPTPTPTTTNTTERKRPPKSYDRNMNQTTTNLQLEQQKDTTTKRHNHQNNDKVSDEQGRSAIFAALKSSQCHVPVRGNNCASANFSSCRRNGIGLPQFNKDTSHSRNAMVAHLPQRHITVIMST